MEQPLLSIIIPVYNVGPYITRCLESALNQTLPSIEIIVINDGSTDDTPDRINRFNFENTPHRIINQPNQGLSHARNVGIQRAHGRYLLFLDGDDWISKEMGEQLSTFGELHRADIINGGIEIHPLNGRAYLFEKAGLNSIPFTPTEDVKSLLRLPICSWNKIYRRQFIHENHIAFREGLLFEDTDFFFKVMIKAKRVVSTDEVYYHFCLREGSISNSPTIRNLDVLLPYSDTKDHIESLPNAIKLKSALDTTYFKCAIIRNIEILGQLTRGERRIVTQELSNFMRESGMQVGSFLNRAGRFYFLIAKISIPLLALIFSVRNFLFKRSRLKKL